MTPQPTPQYGQVVRVSTVLAPSVRFAQRDIDDALVIGANRKRARAAMIGRDSAARFELDRPVVQWTGDAVAEDDALRQRPALVRTAIAQREDAVVSGAEERNVAAAIVRPMHDARAKPRNIVDMADADENQSGVRDDFFHFPRCARLFRKSRL